MGLSTTTNGKVAVKAFKSLNEKTGLKNLEHLAKDRESERFTFDEIAAQPKETITSPTFTGSNQAAATRRSRRTSRNSCRSAR